MVSSLAALAGAVALAGAAGALPAQSQVAPDLEVFVREGCPRCAAAEAFLPSLRLEQPSLQVVVRDVGRDRGALARLDAAARASGQIAGVPAFLARGRLLVGFDREDTTGRAIRDLLAGPSPAAGTGAEASCRPTAEAPCAGGPVDPGGVDVPWLGRLSAREMGLTAFTLALGLLDGFNPCAMWVLLFLLSLLVNMRSRGRMLAVAGTFVAMSGVVYFLFMAAWLNVFLVVGFSRTAQVALGTVALVVGAVNVKDFFALGSGVSFSIPDSAKPAIYDRVRRILRAPSMALAVAGAAVLALLVNAVELLCTAGIPVAYTHVLTQQGLPGWKRYGYLALYNAAYVADDSLMVGVAVVTLSRTRLQERGGRVLKLVSGGVMLALGAALLLAPRLLYFG